MTVESSETLNELKTIRSEAKTQNQGENEGEEQKASSDQSENPDAPEQAQEQVAAPEQEEEIIIAGKTFKTQSEAFKYAEQLAHEKELAEAHTLGIQEALQATRGPVVPQAEPEDDKFEEKFYTNPKAALKELEDRAIAKAESKIEAKLAAKQKEEELWNKFLSKNPDISREDAAMVLQRNWEVLSKMSDANKAMDILATKTRSYYQDIIERTKPRVGLPNRGSQVVSTGMSGVTPKIVTKNEEKPLSFAEQLKNNRRR